MARTQATWVLALLAGLAGCGSQPIRLYDGAPRPATQVATLAVPEAIEVLSVNGAEVKGAHNLLRKGDLTLEFAPGRYELLAYYRDVWSLGDQQDSLRSDPALFDLQAEAGGRYRLEYVHPRRYEDALRLSRAFSGWIEDDAGHRTDSRASHLQFRRDLAGVLGDRSLVGEAAGEGHGVAPLPAPPAAGATARPDRLEPLKKSWEELTPDERRDFLDWARAH